MPLVGFNREYPATSAATMAASLRIVSLSDIGAPLEQNELKL